MLSDALFHPLDLDAALENADEDAAIDILVAALTDRRARGDQAVVEYVGVLLERCQEAGRERDAIDSLQVIAGLEPAIAGTLAAEVALLHADLGEGAAALEVLRRQYDVQRSLLAADKDLDFYASAALTADGLGDADLARALVLDGLTSAMEVNDSAAISGFQSLRNRNAPVNRGHPQRVQFRVAYLPPAAHATARQRGLLDPTVQRDHANYRRELQVALQGMAEARPDASIVVVPIEVDGLVAYAQREGLNPGVRSTRLAYSGSIVDVSRDVTWPPERNGPCWCASGRKYKKCCGAPAFTAVPPPDPASMILKITLDRVKPSVWRRVAAPSKLGLDELHRLIQAAMGWNEQHMYAFDDGDVTITDPRSEDSEHPADAYQLVTLAGEVGLRFGYIYDFGDGWEHTVTVEEIREAGPVNVVEVLDGAGACPPEDCGGPHRYMALVKAQRDAADPDHDDAVELLGLDYDAGGWQGRNALAVRSDQR
jgi:hypothetical protein